MVKKIYNNSRTLGPVSDLEKHLPSSWWKTLFNSLYLKTDGDVVENNNNTEADIDLLIKKLRPKITDKILDLCCGQGRHSIELANRSFINITGIDRSRYLIRLARKRAENLGLKCKFSEGDARKIRLEESSTDIVFLMGNSFGYFEREEDDIAILESIKKILKGDGKIALDIADGNFMRNYFEPRSWEWIDQNHFVCRERSLSSDKTRIISREVIVHAEKGVIADQFYAERLYDKNQIFSLLKKIGFKNIEIDSELKTDSTRGEDLGMMANRIFITARTPVKKIINKPRKQKSDVLVLLGDPRLNDSVKRDGVFNPEDVEVIDRLKANLAKLEDFKFSYLDNHSTFINKLKLLKSDHLILNFCDEGFGNDPFKELHVPSILEMLDLSYSGAGPSCLGVCYDKSVVRAIANSLDISVPDETYFDPSDQAASIPSIFPAILKPNFGDSSVGIKKDSVVKNAKELISYLEYLRNIMPKIPILIQEYLEGNEYSVGIIGNNGNYIILPILEVDYSNLPKDLPQILGYESKWLPDSVYWKNIKYKESTLDEENKRKIIDTSIKLFERTGCRDYARFDFRANKEGEIKLLEVNPNPGWCFDGKLNLMAEFAGYSYHNFLELIIRSYIERIAEN
jgi:D-alanine-D-alanine ligase